MKPPSLSKAGACGLVLAGALAGSASGQSASPWALKAESVQFATSSNGVFQTFGSGAQSISEMRQRLQDPQQRAAVREEQRSTIVENHYGVAEALELNDAQFNQLIELVTDQQFAHFEEFYLRISDRGVSYRPDQDLHARAERMSKDIDALRDVLGPQKLERYQAMRDSLGHRRYVRELDDRLNTPDKLSPTQRERLVELFYDQNMRDIERHRARHFGRSPVGTSLREMPSQEELQRRSQLMTIESNEQVWRDMPESNQRFRDQAAAFLSVAQLEKLEQMHAEQATALQQRIEHMRVQAGLAPQIPDAPEAEEPAPVAIAASVKLSMKFVVNSGKPKYFNEVVSNGQQVSFKIDDGLFAEATMTLFADDMYDLRVAYYETGATGKRLIGNMGQAGSILRAPPGDPLQRLEGGAGGTVISGSKAYAVQTSSVVEAT